MYYIFLVITVIAIFGGLHFVNSCASQPDNCGDITIIQKYEDVMAKKIPANSKILRDYHTMDWKCNHFHKNGYYKETQIDMLIEKKVEADTNILNTK